MDSPRETKITYHFSNYYIFFIIYTKAYNIKINIGTYNNYKYKNIFFRLFVTLLIPFRAGNRGFMVFHIIINVLHKRYKIGN